jgi:hypothetical protein
MERNMKYGPTIENTNAINEKAKTKNDGVYRFRGIVYRVKNNRVTHIASNGKVLERAGYFNVEIGTYENGIGGDTRATILLKQII